MPKNRDPKSVRQRKKAQKETLRARLALPVLDPEKLARLQSTSRRQKTIEQLRDELRNFTAVSEAVRRSHRYYISALQKVYQTWVDLLAIEDVQREALIEELNDSNAEKTKRGDALHVLLRALIDYRCGDPEHMSDKAFKKARQAAWSRLSRDAAVLHHAQRLTLDPEAFGTHVSASPGGLEQIARDEAAARKLDRADGVGAAKVGDHAPQGEDQAEDRTTGEIIPFVPKARRGDDLRRQALAEHGSSAHEGEGAPGGPRWRFGKALKKRLGSATLANREVIMRVFIGADGVRTVRDVYQMGSPTADDALFAKQMEGIEARLVEKGCKRPRV